MAALVLTAAAEALPGQEAPSAARIVRVPTAELVEAMLPEDSYDATKTTNSGRFQAGVYLRLARRALERGDADVLLIQHQDWFDAFVDYAGIAPDDAPVFVQLVRDYEQDALIDLRQDRVIRDVVRGRAPDLALNVRLAFARPSESGDQFSYEDRLSDPAVLVLNDSVVTFRLMDMGDETFYDEVRGSRARPMTGSLGALFAVIGTAEIRSVRTAIGADGTAVSIATARAAMVNVPASVTTSPFGRVERGVPEGRRDLQDLEEKLRRPLEFRYVDMDWDPLLTQAQVVAGGAVRLEVDFIGNMAVRVTDGRQALVSDFPYQSGASGYMEYDDDILDDIGSGVALISHGHADHWDQELFESTDLDVIAPPALTADIDPDRVIEWSDEIALGNIVVRPVATPHIEPHSSYLVEWGGRRLYFTGDTESVDALLEQRDLDAVFISPWLLRDVLARNLDVDTELFVVYHHAAGEEVPTGAGIHVPTQGGRFAID